MVVENSEVPFTSRCLQENNIPFTDNRGENLTAFSFNQNYDNQTSLYWTEEGCFSGTTLTRTKEEIGSPRISISATYGNNIILLGVDFPQKTYHPGEQVEINYYWQSPPADIRDKAVLVHIDHDGYRIQDDHILLKEYDPLYLFAQDGTELLKETRTITIPSDAKPGAYEINIGIYDRNTGTRTEVETKETHKKNKVIMPERLLIQTI